jgi:LemA protein
MCDGTMARPGARGGMAAAILAVALAGCGYDRITSMREDIDTAWGQVESQLQRRNDLLPNLVGIARTYAARERAVFDGVADARARLLAGGSRHDRIDAATALSAALGRVLALADRYPELKANDEFHRLGEELAAIESRIGVERARYNDAVRAYNAYIQSVPTVLYARLLGFEPQQYFETSGAP